MDQQQFNIQFQKNPLSNYLFFQLTGNGYKI